MKPALRKMIKTCMLLHFLHYEGKSFKAKLQNELGNITVLHFNIFDLTTIESLQHVLVWLFCIVILYWLRTDRKLWIIMLIYCRLQDTGDSKQANIYKVLPTFCYWGQKFLFIYKQTSWLSLCHLYFKRKPKRL